MGTKKEEEERLLLAEKGKKRKEMTDSDDSKWPSSIKPTAGKDSSVEILSSSDVEMKAHGEEVWRNEAEVKQEIHFVEDNGSADSEENEWEPDRDSSSPPALMISEVKSLQTGRVLRSSSESSS